MPPPRKSSPRRRERRSRSRSHSPRHRRRSRSHSRSPRDRRRSRSPQRRRSPERKHRSPPRRRSPSPRRRSRSPKRRSRSHSPRRRSRSQSPRRKAPSPRRRSPSPEARNHPVKRPADSSQKRQSFRSRSPSPTPVKRLRDERLYQDENPYEQQRSSKHSRSPVRESPYGGKMYADQPSSSKQPLFPAGSSSKRSVEIDFVTIVEKGPKKPKLNKRFETLEQVAQGGFDFEENITIGIHRGPQHIELDDDEDVEVNYEFNPKTFKMLFPKKNYAKAIFDREEIKAFHHDDILDEEAYVEKRTISIKPVDKPKSRKYDDELDYKITVGAGREGYGDRRMVHDSGSGSRSRPSRSSGYDDIPVTVRLDPRPDPRYEKIYRDQQRHEDQSLMQEKVHRNPNDLRYNLMRRKSDGDNRDRGRDPRDSHGGPSGMMDARSRIEARRQEGYPDRRDRPGDRRAPPASPPRNIERKKASVKTDLPDFKNRPGVKMENPHVWVIGSSVVKDLKQFGETFLDYDIKTLLKNDVASLVTHGEMDMKIEDMLPAVRYLLKSNDPPQMIVFQCGELNVCVGRNVDVTEVMKKDLATIRQEIPGVLLVWSQILPPWMAKNQSGSTLAKSRRRINRFMMQCFVSEEVGGAFLYHPMLRTDLKTKYHMPTSDGFLHLRKEGMKAFIYQLKVGIQYFMTGHGSIFPYMKWPLTKPEIDEFDPLCMFMLNSEHIQSLNLQKLLRFSKEQIQMLTNEQILMFHRNQLHFVYCEEFVEKLSPKQLSGLTKANFLFLSNRQMRLFTDNPERIKWMSDETKEFVQKRMKARRGGPGKRNKKLAEMDKQDAEKNGGEKEWTLGDIMASSESEDGDWFSEGGVDSDDSDRDWVLESSMCLQEYDARSYGSHGQESRRGRERDRSYSRERGQRERYSRERDGRRSRSGSMRRDRRRRSRSGSFERHRSGSRDRHRRTRSRERRRRSHSSDRGSSRRHGSSPGGAGPYPGPYPIGPHPPRMMPPFALPPGMPPRPFPPMPFPGMGPRPPFPPAPFPGLWPGYPMPHGAPVVPGAPVNQPPVVEPPEENWGEGPTSNIESVNTGNLKQIN